MREIPLTKGKVALVDDDDYDHLVAMGKWMAIKGNGGYYAAKNRPRHEKRLGMSSLVMMHNVIMKPTGGETVDHRDLNGLNNQKHNLRYATKSDQIANQKVRSDNTSGSRGVYLDKDRNCWCAEVIKDGKKHHVGRFIAYETAVEACERKREELFGEFYR